MTAVYALAAQSSGCYFDTLDPTLLFSCNLAGFRGLCVSEHLSQRFWLKINTLDRCRQEAWGWAGPSIYILTSFHSKGFFFFFFEKLVDRGEILQNH